MRCKSPLRRSVLVLLVALIALVPPGLFAEARMPFATVVFEDQFDEAGGADVAWTSHTPNTGTVGAEFDDTFTTFVEVESTTDDLRPDASVDSNRLAHAATPSVALGSGDYDVEFTLNAVSSGDDAVYMFARAVDNSNYYAAVVRAQSANGQDLVIMKKVAGVVSTLGTPYDGTMSIADVIKFELRGTTLKIYQGASERVSATDSAFSSAGLVGVGWGNVFISTDDPATVQRIDNFTITDQTSAGGTTPRSLLLMGCCKPEGGKR
jgi:hypothetical protein